MLSQIPFQGSSESSPLSRCSSWSPVCCSLARFFFCLNKVLSCCWKLYGVRKSIQFMKENVKTAYILGITFVLWIYMYDWSKVWMEDIYEMLSTLRSFISFSWFDHLNLDFFSIYSIYRESKPSLRSHTNEQELWTEYKLSPYSLPNKLLVPLVLKITT